jgi:hypothetical protein
MTQSLMQVPTHFEHTLARRLATLGVLLSCVSAPVHARSPDVDAPLAGRWTMTSAPYDGDCSLSGTVVFMSTTTAGLYRCEIVSTEACPSNGFHVTVRQTCVARQTGDQIALMSTVAEIVDPADRYPIENYRADHMTLKQIKSDTLQGTTYDYARSSGVVLKRGDAPIS